METTGDQPEERIPPDPKKVRLDHSPVTFQDSRILVFKLFVNWTFAKLSEETNRMDALKVIQRLAYTLEQKESLIALGVLDKLMVLVDEDFTDDDVKREACRLAGMFTNESVHILQAVVNRKIIGPLVALVFGAEDNVTIELAVRAVSDAVATAMLGRSHSLIRHLRIKCCQVALFDAAIFEDCEVQHACGIVVRKVLEHYHPNVEYPVLGEKDKVERFDPEEIFDNEEPPEEFLWMLREILLVAERMQCSCYPGIRQCAHDSLLNFFMTPIASQMPDENIP